MTCFSSTHAGLLKAGPYKKFADTPTPNAPEYGTSAAWVAHPKRTPGEAGENPVSLRATISLSSIATRVLSWTSARRQLQRTSNALHWREPQLTPHPPLSYLGVACLGLVCENMDTQAAIEDANFIAVDGDAAPPPPVSAKVVRDPSTPPFF
jgi:hypothetical protein